MGLAFSCSINGDDGLDDDLARLAPSARSVGSKRRDMRLSCRDIAPSREECIARGEADKGGVTAFLSRTASEFWVRIRCY